MEREINQPTPYLLDLRPYLQHPKENLGQLVVVIEPTEDTWRVFNKNSAKYNKYVDYHPFSICWVQVTKIALDVFNSAVVFDAADKNVSLGWVTQLVDGKPIEGAKVYWRGDSTVTGKNKKIFFFLSIPK